MPSSSVPCNLTEPRVAGNCPPTILKVVDLPAPLGPISARSSPSRRSKPISSTAVLPPNCLTRPRTSRRAMLPPGCQQTANVSGNALRKCQHDQQNHRAEQGSPVLCDSHEVVLHQGKSGGSHYGSEQRLYATQQNHDQPIDRLAHRNDLRRRTAFGENVERTGQASKCSGHDEGGPLNALRMNANGVCSQG